MKNKEIKLFFVICILTSTIIGANAASGSGYYGGDDGVSIEKEWHTGANLQGDYTSATATNRSNKPAYMKRVYARSGEDGSYSEWVSSGRHSITHQDPGPFKTSKYEARFYWEYD